MKTRFNSVAHRVPLHRLVRPSSEGCCHDCAKYGKYLLEVRLNGNWWHFKCTATKTEARRWLRWRSDCGAKTRMKSNANMEAPNA